MILHLANDSISAKVFQITGVPMLDSVEVPNDAKFGYKD